MIERIFFARNPHFTWTIWKCHQNLYNIMAYIQCTTSWDNHFFEIAIMVRRVNFLALCMFSRSAIKMHLLYVKKLTFPCLIDALNFNISSIQEYFVIEIWRDVVLMYSEQIFMGNRRYLCIFMVKMQKFRGGYSLSVADSNRQYSIL